MPDHVPPPPAQVPYQVPAHLAFHFDATARILRIAYRGNFAITDHVLDIPVCLVKQVAGTIAQVEGKLEQQASTN